MAPPSAHFVRLAGAVRGPLPLDHLREMAESGVVTPETEIAPGAGGPWVPLSALPLCAEIMPVRRVLGFKAAAFEQVNQGPAAPAMDLHETIAQANRPPASFRGREIAVTPLGRPGPRAGEPNDVQEMVLEVGRRVAANTPPVVLPPPPPPFPQWRWFLALAVLGTAGIMGIPLLYGRSYDPMSVTILLGWVVLYDGFLVFVMVADRRLGERLRLRSLEPDKRE